MKYALVTPAKNEEKYIERTLVSVVEQKVKPVKWVIVSDGSTDGTDAIVKKYASQYAFIQLLRRESSERNFGNKVYAFDAGYHALKDTDFDFIGNLDADIELPPDYYQIMMERFDKNPKMGLAGGSRLDWCNGTFVKVHCARNSVGGPFQLFRKLCYEEIGGYRALKLGGIDAVAEIMARQKGWVVRSFVDVVAHHFRCTGTAKGGRYQASFRSGKKLYVIGYHPLFVAFKIAKTRSVSGFIRQLFEIAGYSFASIRQYERQVPGEFVHFLQNEQLDRIKFFFRHRKDPAMATTSVQA